MWIARGTKVYRCAPEQLRKLSPEQESMIRMLPVDMVHMRDVVSARGAGTYLDLSMLSHPPDTSDGAEESQGERPEQQEVAGVGSMDVEEGVPVENDEVGVVPQGEAEAPEREHGGDAGEASPTKRARTAGWSAPSQLMQAMRLNPALLDSGVARASAESSSQRSQNAQDVPVPASGQSDEELEVHTTDADHWVIDHGRSRLIRMHVVERSHNFCPSLVELPVNGEHVEDVCTSVKYFRLGTKVTQQHEWRQSKPKPKSDGLWTGQTEFVSQERLVVAEAWVNGVFSRLLQRKAAKR